jgi:hypothetical protein
MPSDGQPSKGIDNLHYRTGSQRLQQIEIREWWLWAFALVVTLGLTADIVFLSFFGNDAGRESQYWTDLKEWVRGRLSRLRHGAGLPLFAAGERGCGL